mgnify:CR=1 FL=1
MKLDIMGLQFDNVTMDEASARAEQILAGKKTCYAVTPNAEIAYEALYDETLRALINGADLVLPDGAGVVLASKLLKTPLKQKVAGVDFADRLLSILEKTGGGLFLLGTAFIYGAGLESGVDFLFFENFTLGLCSNKFVVGLALVSSAALFKLAAFPFQFWSPDVYQGSPNPVSAFFAVGSKAAGIVFLAQVFMYIDFSALPAIGSKAVFVVSVIAALTIIVGNLGAITQTNAKRLMGFSGIANAGYLLVLLAALMKVPKSSELFELSLYFYMFANYAIFFVINQFEGDDLSPLELSDFRGLIRKNPVADSTLIIALASLAGIPPTAGFFGKLLILILAWYAQLYVLMGIMIAGSVVSIFYYFSWIRASVDVGMGDERRLSGSYAMLPTMIALSAATLVFGVIFFLKY